MKRDMDLCRKILFEIEKQPIPNTHLDIERYLREYDPNEVSYNIMLLHEAGLIVAINLNSLPGYWRAVRLTWGGHEFLDTARDNKRWDKAKTAMTQTGGFALDVMKQLLVQYLKSELKLP